MTDYFSPAKAVLVATNRSGSTMLLHCLDSHPLIGCERSEPVDPNSVWMKKLGNRDGVISALWNRPGYRVNMFKLSYKHVKWIGIKTLQAQQPKIIHLYRENPLRTAVSAFISTAANRGDITHPAHTFTNHVEPTRVTIDPRQLIKEMDKYVGAVQNQKRYLKSLELPILELTYEDLLAEATVHNSTELSYDKGKKICNFLDVPYSPMVSFTKQTNPFPLHRILGNWGAIQETVKQTQFDHWLVGEK